MTADVASDPLGDFQTPVDLAAAVWATLDTSSVDLLIEPTVGLGAFLATAPPELRRTPWLAWDVQPQYVARAADVAAAAGLNASVQEQDAFALDLPSVRKAVTGRRVLAIGNPPWVTNAAQAGAIRPNLPAKWNRFGLRGLDAKTGKANFDIAEGVLLSVLAALETADEVRLAFLVKRSVAIKMAKDLLGTPGVGQAAFARIDARKWFGASVEAGLFELTVHGGADARTSEARIAIADGLGEPPRRFAGFVGGAFVEDVDAYAAHRSVEAPVGTGLVWRQGLKHDLAKVLELKLADDGILRNGFGDAVHVERDALCPFYKSSDVAAGRGPGRMFALYQHDLSGPLPDLEQRWPQLAAYLAGHAERFAARGSSIYRGKPDFMLFGVGAYTLAPYKVAISGFYKEPTFRALGPDGDGNPPLLDDTCYLLPFDAEEDAQSTAEYLNSPEVQGFLRSITDRTAKRPYTKDVLARIAPPLAVLDRTRPDDGADTCATVAPRVDALASDDRRPDPVAPHPAQPRASAIRSGA